MAQEAAAAATRLAYSQLPEERSAGRDALFSLGLAALDADDPAQARILFSTCWDLCVGHEDPQAVRLRRRSRKHQLLAEERLGVRPAPDNLTSAHNLEVYWSDSAGMYFSGWALVNEAATTRLDVRAGRRIVEADRLHRDDIYVHYPVAHASESGFRVYVPGSPRQTITLLLHTVQGVVEIPLHVPDHQLPEPKPYLAPTLGTEFLASRLAEAPDGPVLLIGQRQRTEEAWQQLLAPLRGREVISLDIHPGPGVTMVGDAHQLSSLFEPGSLAAVYTRSVLEHLVAPWLVAAEIATVLAPGGLVFHDAPWIWPTHAEPNDFWRMSPEGLAHLFGPALGFEVLDSAGYDGAIVTPLPAWRDAAYDMPTNSSPAMAWVLARRLADHDPDVRWPYDAETGARVAEEYPVWGLITTPDEKL